MHSLKSKACRFTVLQHTVNDIAAVLKTNYGAVNSENNILYPVKGFKPDIWQNSKIIHIGIWEVIVDTSN